MAQSHVHIADIEIEQLEDRRRRLRNELAAIDYEEDFAQQPVPFMWASIPRSKITVEFIEGRLESNSSRGGWRYCAYHRRFHDRSSFSPSQILARAKIRYCHDFSNDERRACSVPSSVMCDANEVYQLARMMRVRIVDDE